MPHSGDQRVIEEQDMALSTTPVTGTLVAPDGNTLTGGTVTFQLNDWDIDRATDEVIKRKLITAVISASGEISVDLWPNEAGTKGTVYEVYVSYQDATGPVTARLRDIQVPDSEGEQLTKLLYAPPAAAGSYWRSITEEQYDDAIQAVSDAQAAQAAAETALDDLTDIYLGAKASDPTVDNDGDPLSAGMLYWNTTAGNFRVYSGSAWVVLSEVASSLAEAVWEAGTATDEATISPEKLNAAIQALSPGAVSGTVTSVAMTVPTGLEVSGSPITASGTFAITYGTGYQGFLTTDKAKLDHITVTQAVNLDTMETRVNQLDAAVVLKGGWDASVGSFPGSGSAQAGDSYIVTTGGTIDGEDFVANDRIIAITDNASTSTYSGNWLKLDYNDAVLSVNGKVGAIKSLGQVVTTASSANINLGNNNYAHIVQTGPVTRTITSAGREDGIEVTWVAVGGDVTLETEGAELINSGSSYVIPAGSSARLICDGTDWDVVWSSIKADTALQPDTADVLTAGFGTTPHNAGTKSSGTYTPDEANGNIQYAVNGGAHTLAPMSNNGTVIIHYTNNGSAGAITTSGFTLVDGDSFTTTDTDEFLCFLTKANDVSYLTVKALP
jgi:hypothetical protein